MWELIVIIVVHNNQWTMYCCNQDMYWWNPVNYVMSSSIANPSVNKIVCKFQTTKYILNMCFNYQFMSFIDQLMCFIGQLMCFIDQLSGTKLPSSSCFSLLTCLGQRRNFLCYFCLDVSLAGCLSKDVILLLQLLVLGKQFILGLRLIFLCIETKRKKLTIIIQN